MASAVLPTLQSTPIALIQLVSTGGVLDGTVPSDTSSTTTHNGASKTWAASAVGGLFDFGHTSGSVTVVAIEMVLGGQTSYTVAITDGIADTGGNDVTIASGTTAANVFISEAVGSIFLLPGQKIRIKTAGGVASGPWRIVVKGAKTFSEGGLFI